MAALCIWSHSPKDGKFQSAFVGFSFFETRKYWIFTAIFKSFVYSHVYILKGTFGDAKVNSGSHPLPV